MPDAFTCPCCGFAGLDGPAYAALTAPRLVRHVDIPYAKSLGMPSYDVCPCCGYEFGYDDEPGTASGETFESYLTAWRSRGCPWFDPDLCPKDWSLEEQLRRISQH